LFFFFCSQFDNPSRLIGGLYETIRTSADGLLDNSDYAGPVEGI